LRIKALDKTRLKTAANGSSYCSSGSSSSSNPS